MIAAYTIRLSPSFMLDEFITSAEGERAGIDNTPPPPVILQLKRLCTLALQPLRDELQRPVVISSGFRCPRLNRLIGGASDSAHMYGRAADVKVPGMHPKEVCAIVQRLRLPFDRLIYEGTWTHIGIEDEGAQPRGWVMTAHFGPGGTTYTPGVA